MYAVGRRDKDAGGAALYTGKEGAGYRPLSGFDNSNSHVLTKVERLTIAETTTIATKRKKIHLRTFPPLVMHPILVWALLIALNGMLVIQDFGFVEEFMVEAEHFLVLVILGEV